MSKWLAEKASAALAARTSRRGFLTKSAVVGSALAVNPSRYILRPGTAYAAVCECSGSTCDCAALCCDGYTEFCCTLTGTNTCPPGTATGGWWKADGSGFCDVGGVAQARYYLDCNVVPPNQPCSCGCGNGSCANRKACCTFFRYGQCHQSIPTMGPIMCRVVTCTPPWLFDPTCTSTSLTDNNTRFHDRSCLHGTTIPGRPAFVRGNKWSLRDSLDEGPATTKFAFPVNGGIPLMGDWDGDGIKTPGVFLNGTWYLRNSNSGGPPDEEFQFGDAGDVPIVGDWNGNGTDTPGVVRGNQWYLRNSNSTGIADISFQYGAPDDIPVVGDWNADGVDTPGVFRAGHWYLRFSNSSGSANISFQFGDAGDIPVVGDWNADGRTTPGVVRDHTWYLRNTNTSGVADVAFFYGKPEDRPLVWGHT